MSEPCCRGCRGDTPHLFCRAKGCICHVIRNHVINSDPPYADPTSRKAIKKADRNNRPRRTNWKSPNS